MSRQDTGPIPPNGSTSVLTEEVTWTFRGDLPQIMSGRQTFQRATGLPTGCVLGIVSEEWEATLDPTMDFDFAASANLWPSGQEPIAGVPGTIFINTGSEAGVSRTGTQVIQSYQPPPPCTNTYETQALPSQTVVMGAWPLKSDEQQRITVSAGWTEIEGGFTLTDVSGSATRTSSWTYSLSRVPPVGGTIIVEKQTVPDGAPDTFEFTGDLAGTIGDGQTLTKDVPAGVYFVTELVPEDWGVAITCNDPTADSSGTGATATMTVSAGETVTCVFTNSLATFLNIEMSYSGNVGFGGSASATGTDRAWVTGPNADLVSRVCIVSHWRVEWDDFGGTSLGLLWNGLPVQEWLFDSYLQAPKPKPKPGKGVPVWEMAVWTSCADATTHTIPARPSSNNILGIPPGSAQLSVEGNFTGLKHSATAYACLENGDVVGVIQADESHSVKKGPVYSWPSEVESTEIFVSPSSSSCPQVD